MYNLKERLLDILAATTGIELTTEQFSYIWSRGTRRYIHGPRGSGKTTIMLLDAISSLLEEPEQSVYFVCKLPQVAKYRMMLLLNIFSSNDALFKRVFRTALLLPDKEDKSIIWSVPSIKHMPIREYQMEKLGNHGIFFITPKELMEHQPHYYGKIYIDNINDFTQIETVEHIMNLPQECEFSIGYRK